MGPEIQHGKGRVRENEAKGTYDQNGCRRSAKRRSRYQAANPERAGLDHHRDQDTHIKEGGDRHAARMDLQLSRCYGAEKHNHCNTQAFVGIKEAGLREGMLQRGTKGYYIENVRRQKAEQADQKKMELTADMQEKVAKPGKHKPA